MKHYIAELIGTFFLMLAVSFSGDPFAVGLMFMALIYILGPISGTNINPAVSLAFWMRGALSTTTMIGYWIAQIIGATLVVGISYGLTGQIMPIRQVPMNMLAVVGLFEFLLTFILCSAILVGTSRKLKDSGIHGIVVGLTLTALLYFVVNGIYNPAIAVANLIPNLLLYALSKGSNGALPGLTLLVYIIAPLAGGALAAWKYKYLETERHS